MSSARRTNLGENTDSISDKLSSYLYPIIPSCLRSTFYEYSQAVMLRQIDIYFHKYFYKSMYIIPKFQDKLLSSQTMRLIILYDKTPYSLRN